MPQWRKANKDPKGKTACHRGHRGHREPKENEQALSSVLSVASVAMLSAFAVFLVLALRHWTCPPRSAVTDWTARTKRHAVPHADQTHYRPPDRLW